MTNKAHAALGVNKMVTISFGLLPFALIAAVVGYFFWIKNTGIMAEFQSVGKGVHSLSSIGGPPEILIEYLRERDVHCTRQSFDSALKVKVTCGKDAIRNSLFPLDFCCTLIVEASYKDNKLIAPIQWRVDD